MTKWITDRLPTEADGDDDGDVSVCRAPDSDRGNYLHWSYVKENVPWRRTNYWKSPAPAAKAPASQQPEPVDAEFTPPPAEIPELIRTGDMPFYVLVISDDNPEGSDGEPIVWEHPVPFSTTLQAVLKLQEDLNGCYGTSHIAECRIIPQLTREVPANA